ncbi:hypothetical protein WAI453_010221 [Rhynchosporium graminicola]
MSAKSAKARRRRYHVLKQKNTAYQTSSHFNRTYSFMRLSRMWRFECKAQGVSIYKTQHPRSTMKKHWSRSGEAMLEGSG